MLQSIHKAICFIRHNQKPPLELLELIMKQNKSKENHEQNIVSFLISIFEEIKHNKQINPNKFIQI